jgi:glycosyltransferase involved in cell wall biosynthesis
MSGPQITYVIPVCNGDRFLGECLQSILNQSFDDHEIICVDDASRDNTAEIICNYQRSDRRVRYLKNHSNCGPGFSRNVGILNSTGAYIRFVDSDDILPKGSTFSLLKTIRSGSASIARGSLFGFEESGMVGMFPVSVMQDGIDISIFSNQELHIPFWHHAFLISREFLTTTEIRYPEFYRYEDPLFLARVLFASKTVSLTEEVVYLHRRYRKYDGSALTSQRGLRETLTSIEKIKELFLIHEPSVWECRASNFFREEISSYIVNLNPTGDNLVAFMRLACKIWPNFEDESTLRGRY